VNVSFPNERSHLTPARQRELLIANVVKAFVSSTPQRSQASLFEIIAVEKVIGVERNQTTVGMDDVYTRLFHGPDIKGTGVPRDCPMIISHDKLRDFPDLHLFKSSFDSYTVKPAKQFLHSIRKNNYSSDSPEESAGIICICVKKFFNHTKAC
jgi:hypothetical protein